MYDGLREYNCAGSGLKKQQRQVLKMLSATGHRFEMPKLYTWGRVERDSRWNTMLSFAPHDEMKDETPYFQKQNISFNIFKTNECLFVLNCKTCSLLVCHILNTSFKCRIIH
jgi:hypothetical protein